jgi:hypothetical protein
MSLAKWIRSRKPWFFENSKIPVYLSKIAPIDVWAINIGPVVFCQGELSEETRRHEIIHYQQQIELLFVFQWFLYVSFYVIGLVKHKSGKEAYRKNLFEQEAYTHAPDEGYLEKRPWYNWSRQK